MANGKLLISLIQSLLTNVRCFDNDEISGKTKPVNSFAASLNLRDPTVVARAMPEGGQLRGFGLKRLLLMFRD